MSNYGNPPNWIASKPAQELLNKIQHYTDDLPNIKNAQGRFLVEDAICRQSYWYECLVGVHPPIKHPDIVYSQVETNES